MILIQAIAIQFAIAMAFHDAPAVTNFELNGVTPEAMSTFHRNGWWSKVFFCLICALSPGWGLWLKMAAYGLLSGLWVYLLFDPVLNRSRRPRRPWDYLGLNDGDGRFWNSIFGRQAGKIKAVVLLLAIITINVWLG